MFMRGCASHQRTAYLLNMPGAQMPPPTAEDLAVGHFYHRLDHPERYGPNALAFQNTGQPAAGMIAAGPAMAGPVIEEAEQGEENTREYCEPIVVVTYSRTCSSDDRLGGCSARRPTHKSHALLSHFDAGSTSLCRALRLNGSASR
jgi:hypothetical protein